MMYSMTGFATKTIAITAPDGTSSPVVISIKSVNSRFFETNFRLPYQLSSLETELEKRLKKRLYRGHIYVSVQMANPALFKGEVQPSLKTVDGYLDAITIIKARCAFLESITLDHILQLPHIFIVEERTLEESTKITFFEHIEQVIDDLIEARKEEGTTLLIDIKQRVTYLDTEIDIIDKLAQAVIEQHKTKITNLMQELHDDENMLADLRKSSFFALLDKIDIHEEIVRFKSHLENVKKQLESSTREKGKKLDFTLQELAREINTITAKCSDALISSHAINIKVDIEKIREQIQNIV